MKCNHGILTTTGMVPCGRCMACRVNRKKEWASRIYLEEIGNFEIHGVRSWFITLTYNQDNVPKTAEYVQTLRKSEAKRFIRRALRKAGKFRYYFVGEYGDRTMRPHYHAVVFPQKNTKMDALLRAWQPRGFTQISPLTPGRSKYIAQYTTKKLTKADDGRLSKDQEPEFMLASRVPGIGASYVPTLVRHYRGRGRKILAERDDIQRTFQVEGKVHHIPTYILQRTRKELGIPLKHSERLLSDKYQRYWTRLQEDARWDPERAETNRIKEDAKKAINRTRITEI